MGFMREAVEAVGGDWADAEKLNAGLEDLRATQVGVIDPRDPEIWPAKVAWAIVVIEQAMIHRAVMLADGCADTWNSRNVLTSVLAARGLLETIAAMWEFEVALRKRVKDGQMKPLYEAVMRRTFGTRLEGWIADGAGFKAIHINDALRALEEDLEGTMNHYDHISEMCHPNSLGHHQMFTTTEKPSGIVRFNPQQGWNARLYHHITATFFLLQLAPGVSKRIHEMLPRIVEISEAARHAPKER
jgi:hypothetical protein